MTQVTGLPEAAQLPARVWGRVLSARETLPDYGEFVFGWPCEEHHQRWCRALDDERIRRLIVLGPPTSAKSTWVGMIYLSRQIGKNPTKHYAYLTYSDSVAQDRGVAVRDVVETSEFQLVFPKAKPAKRKGWGEGGFFLQRPNEGDPDPTLRAAGIFGAVLAYHFEEILLDDPHDPEEVLSKTQRDKAHRRFTTVIMPRQRPGVRIIVTGFRWAEDDIPGRLMSMGCHADDECNGRCEDHSEEEDGEAPSEWHVVHTKSIETMSDGTEKSYWPGPWPLTRLYAIRNDISASVYACQYQGLPAPEEGHIFKWYKTYRVLPDDIMGIVIGLDTAFTEEERSDSTAWTAWAYDGKQKPWKYWLEAGEIKAEMPEAEKHAAMFVRKIQRQYPRLPVRLLVRSRVAIDRVAAQHLRTMGIDAIEVKMPSGGARIKLALANMIAPEFESGRAMVPENAPPCFDPWLHQHKIYDRGAHDDYVETTIVVMRYFAGPTVSVDRIPMRRVESTMPILPS
ncbi:hypothetical protein LCGC14_0968970 [marine sediment metagenome]|uniref:Terminase large subunit gp17-like C-terminal domain-containing protein n=1 Tax=marine sediment metagenome TaxID=412755 RepID=A0A0F9QVE1_9ZZZZ